jgi:hypothetical protein
MNWFQEITRRKQRYGDLAEEMRLHLDEKIERLTENGMDRRAAIKQAKREFGNATVIAERSYEIWRWRAIEGIWNNLRHAARRLKGSPGFTITCVLTIAIAIGANTAIFTVDYAALLAPLPYPHPDQLVTISSRIKGNGGLVSAKEYADWQRESRAFQNLTAYTGGSFNIASGNQLENVFGMQVQPNYYCTFGSSFSMGRDFLPEEGQEGKNHVAILTHQLWQHLGSDPNLVGHTMPINGEPYTVVGVLLPGIDDRNVLQISVPLVLRPEALTHDAASLSVVGRLKPSFTISRLRPTWMHLRRILRRAMSRPSRIRVHA